jgi:hypothetical protein
MLTRDELLDILIVECSEVIKAAMKCKRFGWNNYFEGYGSNDRVFGLELGDMQAVADELLKQNPDIKPAHDAAYDTKIGKATTWKHSRKPK